MFFEPGTYGSAADPLVFEVGYYTEVAGLGAVPQDTTINGQIEVFPNALDCATATNCWANSTVNFWRSMSNLTLNVMDSANNYVPQPITQLPPIGDSADCYGGSTDMWSVSQATPVRDMIINGNLNFQAYCSQTGYGQRLRQRQLRRQQRDQRPARLVGQPAGHSPQQRLRQRRRLRLELRLLR